MAMKYIWERQRVHIKFWLENLKARDYMEGLHLAERRIIY
jgi:hypothetical protein